LLIKALTTIKVGRPQATELRQMLTGVAACRV
jgi:hypothetical protein